MAQKEIAPGFIITNINDTIRGTLFDKDWDVSPRTIKFKAPNESDYKTYSVNDIKAFSVDGKYVYLSSEVLMDVSSLDIEKLLREGQPADTVTVKIFMKELVRGKMSLSYHKDNNAKAHFFIQKNGSAFVELILRKYKTPTDDIMLQEKFRGQLAFYINDCPAMIENIKQVHFDEDGIANLVIAYNKCFNEAAQTTSEISKPSRLKCGIVVGYFTSKITFTGTETLLGIQDADFKPYHNFTVGMTLNLRLSRRFERHQIVNEILWKSLKFNDALDMNGISSVGLPTSYHREYILDINYIKLNTLYRYNYMSGQKMKLFFDVGFSNSLAVHMNCTFHTEEKTAYHNYVTEVPLFQRKHEQALTAGLGAYYLDKFGIKFSFENSNGMSDYSDLKTTVNSFYFFFNYIISKR